MTAVAAARADGGDEGGGAEEGGLWLLLSPSETVDVGDHERISGSCSLSQASTDISSIDAPYASDNAAAAARV